MVDRITSIAERDCKVVETVDTTYPGFIEASRTLVHTANKLIADVTGEADSVLAGELLLLSGLSSLLYAHGSTPQNMAVHFTGLRVKGSTMSTQSIYVAMDKPVVQQQTPTNRPSPRSIVTQKELNIQTAPDTYDTAEEDSTQIFDVRQLQAELDSQLPDEVLQEAHKFESDARRFYDEPSMADAPLTKLPSPKRSPLQIPQAIGGLHASYDVG